MQFPETGSGRAAANSGGSQVPRVLAPTPTAPPLAVACSITGLRSHLEINKHLLKYLLNERMRTQGGGKSEPGVKGPSEGGGGMGGFQVDSKRGGIECPDGEGGPWQRSRKDGL